MCWDLTKKEHVLFRKHMFLKEMENLEMHFIKFSTSNVPVFSVKWITLETLIR